MSNVQSKNEAKTQQDRPLFKYEIFSERLNSLRIDEEKDIESEKHKYSFDELSKAIAAKMSVRITGQQLAKYENSDKNPPMPTLNKLLAIADFFNVSIDYLIGKSKVPASKFSYIEASETFGLSQKAMEAMEFMNTHNDIGLLPPNYKKCSEMTFLNIMIVNFSKTILSPAIEYFRAYENYIAFVERYEKNKDGKSSKKYLDLEGLPIGIEDSLIDEAQELKNMLDIKRMNILNKMEEFLKRIRKNLIEKGNDDENN